MDIKELQRIASLRALCASGGAKQIRLAAGVSLWEVSRATNVSQASTIKRWEEGGRIPGASNALRYADVLDALSAISA